MTLTTHELPLDGVHAYVRAVVNGGQSIALAGWDEAHWHWQPGDYVVLMRPDGSTTRYQFTAVEHCGDPPDMYFAEAVFAPRLIT